MLVVALVALLMGVVLQMPLPLRKRCRMLSAGGLGVSPSFENPPILGD